MLVYKLTSQDNKTYNDTLWGEGISHQTDGAGGLCGPGWLHFYYSPKLAVLLNPIHGNIKNPKLWECEASGKFLDNQGLKGGCTHLTTLKQIDLPEFNKEQRVKFAILCSKKVFDGKSEVWDNWSGNWLNGTDR